MKEADKQRVLSEMDALMRSLRRCDTQAQAIDWMTRAYNAMDSATQAIGALDRMLREEHSENKGLIFHIPKPKIEIVQSIPMQIVHRAERSKSATYQRATGQTVVYPDFFLHPGLKPTPKAWTHKDTLRLEAASEFSRRQIVRKGR